MLNQCLNNKIFRIAQSLSLCLMLLTFLPVPGYARQLDHNDNNDKPSQNITDENINSIKISLQISLNQLAQHHPDALELIYVLSMFDSKNIPHGYIEKWLELSHKQGSISEISKLLIDLSLIDITTGDEHGKQSYSLHDLVHKTIRDLIPSQDKTRIIDQAVQVMLNILPKRPDLLVEKVISEPIHLQHAEAISKIITHMDYMSQNSLNLKIRIFEFYLDGARDFEKGKLFYDDIEQIFISNKIQLDPYDNAMFMVHKSFFTAMYKPDYNIAINYSLEAYNLLKNFDSLFEEKLLIATNIAQGFTIRGVNGSSHEWLKKAEKLYENSKSNVYNIFYLFAHQMSLINNANYIKALQNIEVVKKYVPLVSDYPIMQFAVLDQEIELLLKIKSINKAKICNDGMLKKITEFFQSRENSYLARYFLYTSWINLETRYDYNQAIADIKQSIDITSTVYHGPNVHFTQGLQHMILGRALEGQQKYAEALAEYQFAERIYEKILEQLNGMDDVSMLYQHLVNISLKLNQPEQAKQYLKIHIDLFGSDHLRSQEMKNILN